MSSSASETDEEDGYDQAVTTITTQRRIAAKPAPASKKAVKKSALPADTRSKVGARDHKRNDEDSRRARVRLIELIELRKEILVIIFSLAHPEILDAIAMLKTPLCRGAEA